MAACNGTAVKLQSLFPDQALASRSFLPGAMHINLVWHCVQWRHVDSGQ